VATPLERKLIVVTGKGGVGKTTVSAALGLLAVRQGLRTIVVEVTGPEAAAGTAGAGRLAALLGQGVGGSSIPPRHGVETELREGLLWSLSIDRDRVLAEWLRAIGGRVPARVLTSSSSFQYLVAAAPGAREMLSMIKVWELAQGRRPQDRGSRDGHRTERAADYDLVVLDAPATGHALAMLRSPRTFSAIARVGPIARQSGQVRELLEDPARSAYLAVTHATEMAVTETLELREGLRRDLDRELDGVVVNGTLPRRFEGGELERIAALNGAWLGGASPDGAPRGETSAGSAGARTAGVSGSVGESESAGESAVRRSAVRAAHAVHERARSQQNQLARLRREGLDVARVPFAFKAELDLAAVEEITDRLGAALSHSPKPAPKSSG
jgi:anion-transporting  ArsA/GET3 family ATPase